VNRDSAGPVYQHAAELRHRALFAEVREAFWKQEPLIRPVLASIASRRIFVVPLFISEGYFTEQIIPAELGFQQPGIPQSRRDEAGRVLHYCGPVGTHASMSRVILARAEEVTRQYPFPRAPQPAHTALLLAGHGTERNENSRRAVEQQAERIRSLGLYAEVRAVFMEEEPLIRDVYQLAQPRNLVVVPFFISDGLHAYEDIPMLLGEPQRLVDQRLRNGQPPWRNPTERNGKLIWYARSVGTEPHICDVILERVREAAAASSGSSSAASAVRTSNISSLKTRPSGEI
jgi:sirohydrochlorin cobaltochelatase